MNSAKLQETTNLLDKHKQKSHTFRHIVYITTDGENAKPASYTRNSGGRGVYMCIIGFTTAVLLLTCLVAMMVVKANKPHIDKDHMAGYMDYSSNVTILSNDGQGAGDNILRSEGGLLLKVDQRSYEDEDTKKTQETQCSPSFLLYTTSSYLPVTASNIPSEFDPRRKTVFLVHGFQFGSDNSWVDILAAALKSKEHVNVIVVDWRKEAGPSLNPLTWLKSYQHAVDNTQVCAQQLAGFFKMLMEKGLSREDGHCIGHSLGAQLCGLAGKHSTWGRISGLDPAGPHYRDLSCSERLCSSDANYVDVIHTDGTNYGLMEKSGHLDFYPNGGMAQPGCDKRTKRSAHTCNHSRSHAYYISSVTASNKPCFSSYKKCTKEQGSDLKLKCTPCQHKCQEMGYYSIKYRESLGIYYVNTTSKSPYCI